MSETVLVSNICRLVSPSPGRPVSAITSDFNQLIRLARTLKRTVSAATHEFDRPVCRANILKSQRNAEISCTYKMTDLIRSGLITIGHELR